MLVEEVYLLYHDNNRSILQVFITLTHGQIQRGGTGVLTRFLENHKLLCFLRNTGREVEQPSLKYVDDLKKNICPPPPPATTEFSGSA